jgi:hypothetical protein
MILFLRSFAHSDSIVLHRVLSAVSVPDFSGVWAHPSGQSGFEPLPSGPRPVTGRLRRNGVSDPYQYVGDYTNPILKPEAAEVVKNHDEIEFSEQRRAGQGGEFAWTPASIQSNLTEFCPR